MRLASSALYLANSWFWCIGGFFPVLLFLDFGDAAFLVFAGFNIVGAAAFGVVWSDLQRRAFLKRMKSASAAFSLVVIVFHALFMVWASMLLGSAWPIWLWLAATIAVTAVDKRLHVVSAALFVLTLCLFAIALFGSLESAAAPGGAAPFLHQIAPLALGFVLAPYFDLTFHRAFEQAARPALTFIIGLGGLFAIYLAAMYLATPILATVAEGGSGGAVNLIIAAIALQAAFTTSLHAREVSEAMNKRLGSAGLAVAGGLVAFVTLLIAASVTTPFVFDGGALIYRVFVFVIGAVFPVILLFGGLNRWSVSALIWISPCYTLGFLIGGEWAPLLTLAMVGLATIFAIHRLGHFGAQSQPARQ